MIIKIITSLRGRVHGAKRSDTIMVCNGLYVHSFVNTDCNNTRRYVPRLARRVEMFIL